MATRLLSGRHMQKTRMPHDVTLAPQ
jgi:hypothetical protein